MIEREGNAEGKKNKLANPHDGHRDRVRKKVRATHLVGMSSHEVIEYILFHTIPRIDVNELAHELLDYYGSYSGVLDASYEELIQLKGISENTATLISSLKDLHNYYNRDKWANGITFQGTRAVAEYAAKQFAGCSEERILLICLNTRQRLLKEQFIAWGSVNQVSIPRRKLLEIVVAVKAVSILIAHNHPGGTAMPSSDDIAESAYLKRLLNGFGIELKDSIIVADDGDYVSMRESHYFDMSDTELHATLEELKL